MIFRQSMMVLNTIMENPGLTISELGSKIEGKYGKKDDAVMFMFLDDLSEKSHFMSIINGLYCVEKKDDQFFFVEYLPVKDESDINQVMIRGYLEAREARQSDPEK